MKVYAFIIMLAVCTLGLGPGCIFTLAAIAKWECSSYGRALALHARGTGSWVVIDSLESLKQTYARETAKLAGLTDVMAETLAGIHEKEGHVARLDLND
ncbi:hypothetical protein Tco_0887591 [Tanacetum coccineum]